MIKWIASIFAGLLSAVPAFASLPADSGRLLVRPDEGALNSDVDSGILSLQNQNCSYVDEFNDDEGKMVLEFRCLDHSTVAIPNGLLHLASSNDVTTTSPP